MTPFTTGFRVFGLLLACVLILAVSLLGWGAALLIAPNSVPQHVDVAIVLQGSAVAQKARIAGAMKLLGEGIADRVLLSVPQESYWGQPIPPVARIYLERNYGSQLATRVDFCEASADVDSTEQEAEALRPCIQEHHWHSIVVVTSDYHTRRARMLWKRIVARDAGLQLWFEGVPDPQFQQPWWRHRESAKIWLMESSKLLWSVFG